MELYQYPKKTRPVKAVSYTHLDVYKRQGLGSRNHRLFRLGYMRFRFCRNWNNRPRYGRWPALWLCGHRQNRLPSSLDLSLIHIFMREEHAAPIPAVIVKFVLACRNPSEQIAFVSVCRRSGRIIGAAFKRIVFRRNPRAVHAFAHAVTCDVFVAILRIKEIPILSYFEKIRHFMRIEKIRRPKIAFKRPFIQIR